MFVCNVCWVFILILGDWNFASFISQRLVYEINKTLMEQNLYEAMLTLDNLLNNEITLMEVFYKLTRHAWLAKVIRDGRVPLLHAFNWP